LPSSVSQWFQQSGDRAVASLFNPNKDELWLHMSLLESASDRRAVFFRRLMPKQIPGPVDAVHLRPEDITWKIQIRKRWRYLLFFSTRLIRHLRLTPPTLSNGFRWWLHENGISPGFMQFLAAAAVFELGLFIFYLLFNLLLLDRGFHEDFLGANSGAMQIGAIAGTIPGGLAAQRWGLKKVLTVSFLGLAIVSALRVLLRDSVPLLGLAFLSGMISSCWAVCIAPAVADLTSAEKRPLAFSLFFSTGIGIGVLGGVVGGHLPAMVTRAGAPAALAKQTSILIGCALIALAALLVSHLKLTTSEVREARLYPRERMLWRFLLVLAAFNLGTGAFNPLYTAFLSSVAKLPVERIGSLFAISQFGQVGALLLAPLIVKRLGLHSAITCMLAATGIALLCVSAGSAGLFAAGAYVIYMCFQYMSEPGTFSLLMSLVSPSERKGASMLNFLAVNGAQALAAFVAGAAVTRLGYGPVLGVAAAVVLLSALLFRLLIGRTASSITSST
jgi:predicted MFS family arabinose efflux permease